VSPSSSRASRSGTLSTAVPGSALDVLRGVVPTPALRHLGRDDALFRQGDPAAAVYGVVSGRMRLVRHTAEGSAVTVAVARAGEALAEASLFAAVYHCDAVADVPSAVVIFPAHDLRAALGADPGLASRFLALLARQVQELRARLELRNVRSAPGRVQAYLDLVASGALAAPPAGRPLKDLAAELGLTPEAFYRTLARLEREGTIARAGRAIVRLRGASGRWRSPGDGAGGGRRGP
jgi:CRP/FNR family transcriptional regulator, dissimilatory nitrate respiration regulator